MIYRIFSALALFGALAVVPAVSHADTIVRCESRNYDHNTCIADTRGGVSLVNQVSDSACIEGRNWGYGSGRIWVDDGCAADFRVNEGYAYRDEGYSAGRRYARGVASTVTCESIDNQRMVCDVPSNNGVRLLHQISDSPCVRGSSWGASRHRVWVDDGCRAEFEIIR